MKSRKQSAGQKQLKVIRGKYCPDITEQIQRDKTGEVSPWVRGQINRVYV